jgi:hypothetical protein
MDEQKYFALTNRDTSDYMLDAFDCTFAVYTYKYEDYAGTGVVIFQVKGRNGWYMSDLSHCSCYDGFERLMERMVYYKDLMELKMHCSQQLYDDIVPHLEFIKNRVATMYPLDIKFSKDDLLP